MSWRAMRGDWFRNGSSLEAKAGDKLVLVGVSNLYLHQLSTVFHIPPNSPRQRQAVFQSPRWVKRFLAMIS